mgnify:FL=1
MAGYDLINEIGQKSKMLDTAKPNARGDHVRPACRQRSANRESPGFIRGGVSTELDERGGYIQEMEQLLIARTDIKKEGKLC